LVDFHRREPNGAKGICEIKVQSWRAGNLPKPRKERKVIILVHCLEQIDLGFSTCLEQGLVQGLVQVKIYKSHKRKLSKSLT
jgi:hypothetical protein